MLRLKERSRFPGSSTAGLAAGLGIAQLVAWGTLFYSIAVLGDPMGRELRLGDTEIYGAFTASLLIAGLAAPWAGRLIDVLGGRAVLAASSVLGAGGMTILSIAGSFPSFVAGWALNGLAMAGGLYDATFAAVAQASGAGYRRVVTRITLLGGLAGTVFGPLAYYLLQTVGWRGTLAVFAGLLGALCLPLYLLVLPARRGRAAATSVALRAQERTPSSAPGDARLRALLLTITLAASAFITSALSAHLIPTLGSMHLPPERAIWIASLVGVMQVGGRLADLAWGARLPPAFVGVFAFAALAGSLLLLLGAGVALGLGLLFAVVYGAANGVITIVRATVPLEMFGRDRAGAVLGGFAAPSLVARALGPLGFALLIDGFGVRGAVAVTAAVAFVSLGAYVRAVPMRGRQHGAGTASDSLRPFGADPVCTIGGDDDAR